MKTVSMYSAAWCGPCKQAKPLFLTLAETYPDVKFQVVDVDESEEADALNITSIPTFIVFEDGKEAARLVGAHNVNQLKKLL